MKCQIPVYVEAARGDGGVMGYRCAPLFSAGPRCFDVSLSRAMSKLTKRLKPVLDKMGEQLRHDELLRALFNPELESKVLKLRLDLPTGIERTRLLFVVLRRFDQRVAFSPSLGGLWFDVAEGEDLEARAREVLTATFRRQIKEARRGRQAVRIPTLAGQAWIASMDIDVSTKQTISDDDANKFAMLWETEVASGPAQLQRVGRCLDWLYPDGLKHAVLREDEVGRLGAALRREACQPVALVGPRLSGKTSVLHEVIRRVVARRGSPYGGSYGHWLISPQRLISGMSYVGQWESRLLAIVREARRRGHVLCFDNFLGLFEAGKSSCSELSVIDVLRNHIMRRHVRVVGEMSSEQWAALQERDRGLADQFQVIRIHPTNDEDTMRILIHERRRLEREFRCTIGLDAIPAIWEIHRRYDRGAAFPGKAAGFMRRLASKANRTHIGSFEAYNAFSASTGLAYRLLDGHNRLTRDEVVRQLEQQVIGQKAGVAAAADAVMLSKAGLNDPAKPIATMLFLGPTGVGKTQCAKSLAETMFSDASRLIRFDMNEFGTYAAAARLVGSRGDPDGLLTAAVRRQPYAVILLDEIEKAHQDVFDLLLQVLGEGRLTDARGRTADFTNTVIVMTSNLGVRQSSRVIGWNGKDRASAHVYAKAARQFFRPEFFNRIDRIVPFESLERKDMARIAELTIAELLNREGLVARRTALQIDSEAMDLLVTRGYHPQLGARALKRTVETSLAQPVARRLAKLKRDAPTLLGVDRRRNRLETRVHVFTPVEAACSPGLPEPPEVIRRLEAFCARVRGELDAIRPTGAVSANRLAPEALRYYALQEQLQATREAVDQARDATTDRGAVRMPARPPLPPRIRGWDHSGALEQTPGERRSAYEIAEFHDDVTQEPPNQEKRNRRSMQHVVQQAALLEAMLGAQSQPERVVVLLRPLVAFHTIAMQTALNGLRYAFFNIFEYDLEMVDTSKVAATSELPFAGLALRIAGVGVWPLVQVECGTHLIERDDSGLLPFTVTAIPYGDEGEVNAILEYESRRQRDQWRAQHSPATREGGKSTECWNPPPVVRHYRFEKSIDDYRVGCERSWSDYVYQRAEWILEALPLPRELAQTTESPRAES